MWGVWGAGKTYQKGERGMEWDRGVGGVRISSRKGNYQAVGGDCCIYVTETTGHVLLFHLHGVHDRRFR